MYTMVFLPTIHIMSTSLIQWSKRTEFLKKGTVPTVGLILLMVYLAYLFLFQTLTVLASLFLGTLACYYCIHLKMKHKEAAEQAVTLIRLSYFIKLSLDCNQNFQKHQSRLLHRSSLPWESLLGFYSFSSLPCISLEQYFFLQKGELNNALFDELFRFNNQINTISIALRDLSKNHHNYLERRVIWESKIKTLKGFKEMQAKDLSGLMKNVDESLVSQLMLLSTTIKDQCDSLDQIGNHLLELINKYI